MHATASAPRRTLPLESSMQPDPAASAPSRRPLHVAGGLIALIAIVVVVIGIATRSSDAARLRERAEVASVPTVVVVSPTKANRGATLDLPGRIEAYSRAPIYARVSGYLKSWKADI